MDVKKIPSSASYSSIMLDLLETLKSITSSTEAHLYVYEDDKLYRIIKGHCTAYPTGWKLVKGTIPAAYSAFTKSFFYTNNGLDKQMFRFGIGRANAKVDKVLCIPILHPKGKVFGVLELSKHLNASDYSSEDVDMAVTICAWASSAIYRNSNKTLITNDDLLTTDFLSLLEKYTSRGSDYASFISKIMIALQKYLGAHKVIFLEVLKSDPYIVIDYYKRNKDSPRLEKNNKKRCLNYNNDADILYSLKKMDIFRRTEVSKQLLNNSKQKMYDSVLCCPIFNDKKPIGVAVFWKKNAPSGFTWYDEIVAINSLANLLIANNCHKMAERNWMKLIMSSNIFNMVIYQLRPCYYDFIFLKDDFNVMPEIPPNFFKFSFCPSKKTSKHTFIKYCMVMYRMTLGESFLQKNPRIGEFLFMVYNNYRCVPYHNFEHAFLTMHAMFNILIRNRDKFFPIENMCLLTATICHDMDHPAYSNAYLKLIDSYMWQLYQESSTLEYHHSFFALYLIQHCELFCYMNNFKFKLILNKIKEAILATDLTRYFKVKAEMIETLSGNGFHWAYSHHRDCFNYIMMTTCDLSSSFKHSDYAVPAVMNLYEEFFSQGDHEKKRGVTPLAIMDRSLAETIPQGQFTFLSIICLPCFEIVKEIAPNCEEIVTLATALVEFWKKQIEDRSPDMAALLSKM